MDNSSYPQSLNTSWITTYVALAIFLIHYAGMAEMELIRIWLSRMAARHVPVAEKNREIGLLVKQYLY